MKRKCNLFYQLSMSFRDSFEEPRNKVTLLLFTTSKKILWFFVQFVQLSTCVESTKHPQKI